MSGAGLTRLSIEHMGSRGEGVATVGGEHLYVPYALPGELVSVDREGERGTLVGLLEPSPDRIPPFCPYFTTCGGCAIQAWALLPYAEWKRGLVVAALARAGIPARVAPLLDAHGAGRRRATFHARIGADGRVRVGFMQARAHAIVPIESCPILDPGLAGALPAARAIAQILAPGGKPLDILCTATDSGLDIDLRGHGHLDGPARERLVAVALAQGLARLSNHGTIVVERQKPSIAVGTARVELPPGAFLQSTAAGEKALAGHVVSALADAKRVADLFSGIGTFALQLARTAEVTAVDMAAPALAALDNAARKTSGLHAVSTQTRDLYRRPLTAEELARYDAVCLDPPRAGAEAQVRAIAASTLRTVVSVACDVGTFARDAAILQHAGFTVDDVSAVDQFRYSAHVELVATFRRPAAKRSRRLLG